MKPLFALFYIVFIGLNATAQTKEDYILNYVTIAVSEMEEHKIPASITLAQGILESRYGTSELSSKSNNHFGIKCHNSWLGEKVYYNDDKKDDCFRKYQSVEHSFKDRSEFLKKNRYAHLFELSIYDYKGWAKGLMKSGYATDRKYSEKLIKIIEEYELYKFDTMNTNTVFTYVQQQRNNIEPVLTASIPNQPKVIEHQSKKPTVVKQQPKSTVTTEQPIKRTVLKKDVVEKPAVQAAQPVKNKPKRPINVNREIFIVNDIQTVHSSTFDTPKSIAELYDIDYQRLTAYNEWDDFKNEFIGGMNIYLQPKRKKARNKNNKFHKVEYGQTMYQIAQQHGIKTKSLYKLNAMNFELGEQPEAGTMISLRKKLKNKPTLRNNSIKATYEPFDKANPRPISTPKTVKVKQNNEETPTPQAPKEEIIQEPKLEQPIEQKQQPKVIKPAGQPISSDLPPEGGRQSVENPFPILLTADLVLMKTLNEELYEGRAIIYEPTPAINQQPVPIYYGAAQTIAQTTTVNYEDVTEQIAGESTATRYTVKKGDTLYGISRKTGVSVAQIKQWNNLSSNTIKVGQHLIIKK